MVIVIEFEPVNMLKNRQKSILEAAVEEYIRTAHPVASRELMRHFHHDLSPATIRNEMLILDELGYLEQPHTSAGRIPTDKGYRFFVDNIPAGIELSAAEERLLRKTFQLARDGEEFIREFTKTVSSIADTFAAAGIFEEDIFYETGFSRIMDEPEFDDAQQARRFGHLADFLDEEIKNLFESDGGQETVYIGNENPLREARMCSMTVSAWGHPHGFRGFLTIVGPKRTDYRKHKAIINNIKKLTQEYGG